MPSAQTVALTPMRFYPAFNVISYQTSFWRIHYDIFFNSFAAPVLFIMHTEEYDGWNSSSCEIGLTLTPHIKNFSLFNLSVSIIWFGSYDTNQIWRMTKIMGQGGGRKGEKVSIHAAKWLWSQISNVHFTQLHSTSTFILANSIEWHF